MKPSKVIQNNKIIVCKRVHLMGCAFLVLRILHVRILNKNIVLYHIDGAIILFEEPKSLNVAIAGQLFSYVDSKKEGIHMKYYNKQERNVIAQFAKLKRGNMISRMMAAAN